MQLKPLIHSSFLGGEGVLLFVVKLLELVSPGCWKRQVPLSLFMHLKPLMQLILLGGESVLFDV